MENAIILRDWFDRVDSDKTGSITAPQLKDDQVSISYSEFNALNKFLIKVQHYFSELERGHEYLVPDDVYEVESLGSGGYTSASFHLDGLILGTGTSDSSVKIWDVTKRVETQEGGWKKWNWRSEGDLLLNGAFFTPSGVGAAASYARASSLGAKSSSLVVSLTSGAGALTCRTGSQY